MRMATDNRQESQSNKIKANVIDTGYEVSLKSQICYCHRFSSTSSHIQATDTEHWILQQNYNL